ncbi:hypothetical protein GUITHDRAFT_140491 [Guillardia theta CCMP2712]|uniref:TNFR-Cys domain-containing protein n=1 Tax=Guillardia theta (strain CCMP2712) TaxID=905079 RepID=L1J546_GUITC|nr:hypothetical protein GUITHDRAFT_140491 [Guillardia theta CCMP2712]EKX43447.1 hypothetical protein GUITHDRAFT_140491 [Guillardia theta CCMP2712]|eukprot:XP_005830427.1 hypothetical protein GUITHDRAFT_140491 [Guillardia theta CCMP2712]
MQWGQACMLVLLYDYGMECDTSISQACSSESSCQSCVDPNSYQVSCQSLNPGHFTGCDCNSNYYWDSSSHSCLKCATCSSGKYRSGGCISTSDTVCSTCSTCPSGKYRSGGCSNTSDSACSTCSTCPSGYYKTGGCSGTHDTVCSPCSSCPSGYYKTGGCSGTSDSVCSPCTCSGNVYLSIGCSLSWTYSRTLLSDTGSVLSQWEERLYYNKQNQLLFVRYYFFIHADWSSSGGIDYSTYYDDNSSLAAYISTNSTAIYTDQILRFEKGNTMGTGFYWNSGPTYNVVGHAYSINVYIATWSNPVCSNCSTCPIGKYISSACSNNSDTVCAYCSTCPSGKYISSACSNNSDTVCSNCSTCSSGKDSTCSSICNAVNVMASVPCTMSCPNGSYSRYRYSINFARSCTAGACPAVQTSDASTSTGAAKAVDSYYNKADSIAETAIATDAYWQVNLTALNFVQEVHIFPDYLDYTLSESVFVFVSENSTVGSGHLCGKIESLTSPFDVKVKSYNPQGTFGFSAAIAQSWGASDMFFICKLFFQSNVQNGLIFEAGGSDAGTWLGIRDSSTRPVLRLRAGDGGTNITVGSGGTSTASCIDVHDFPSDDQYHIVAWQYIVSTRTINLWIDGALKGTSSTTEWNSAVTSWSGGDDATYILSCNSSITVGEATAGWPNHYASDLYQFSSFSDVPQLASIPRLGNIEEIIRCDYLGQYVTIQKPGRARLGLSEVAVYGGCVSCADNGVTTQESPDIMAPCSLPCAAGSWSPSGNAFDLPRVCSAGACPSTQTSTASPGTGPDKAIDGYFNSPQSIAVTSSVADLYWQVDLQSMQLVQEVRIYPDYLDYTNTENVNVYLSNSTVLGSGRLCGTIGTIILPLDAYVTSFSPSSRYGFSSAISQSYGTSDQFFICRVLFPTNITDGLIFEAGATYTGTWIGVRDSSTTPVFRFRAGNGSTSIPVGGSIIGAACIDLYTFPADGLYHIVAWQYIISTGTINLWLDGVLAGTASCGQFTGGSAFGANDGTYMYASTAVNVGEPSTGWPKQYASDLYRFNSSTYVPELSSFTQTSNPHISMNCSDVGQYIRLEKAGTGVLGVSEVAVYGGCVKCAVNATTLQSGSTSISDCGSIAQTYTDANVNQSCINYAMSLYQ